MLVEIAPFAVGVPAPVKQCVDCGEVYPATTEHFYKAKTNRDGMRNQCKQCSDAVTKAYSRANSDRINTLRRPRSRKLYAEMDQDRKVALLEKSREYGQSKRDADPDVQQRRATRESEAFQNGKDDRRREAHRRWYAANSERAREYQREYAKAHQEQQNARNGARRAIKMNAPVAVTAEDLAAIRAAQTDKKGRLICWRCHKPIKDSPDLDHFIPLAKGGSHTPGNLHYMHARCNRTKHAKHPHDLGMLI
jgi:hypothetical protein